MSDETHGLFPTPWRVEIHPRHSRSRIIAADGHEFISGMNNYKARRIVDAVNRDAAGADCSAAATAAERERCASIALAIDSGRGNEKEIAAAIRRGA